MPQNKNIQLPSLLSASDIFEGILARDPIYFVEKYRTVKGFPFQIRNTGRDYLIGVYNHIVFDAAKKEGKPVVVVKGRQVEFTETMLNICLYFLFHYTNFNILYAFPTMDQVRRFSKDRFNGAIAESTGSKLEDLWSPEGSKNVHHKQFRGNTQIFLYSAWGQAESLRGITCDMLVKDEVQDWSQGGIQNTQESMIQSRYQIDLSLGTPKAEGTYYHGIWKKSDKRYFHVKCIHCEHFFVIELEHCKKLTLIECPKCKKLQEKKDAIPGGKWVSSVHDANNKDYVGFHLSQILHPNITIESVYKRRRDYGERKFKNEILGEFTGSMDRPLSPQDIIDMIKEQGWNSDEYAYPSTIAAPLETVMGIDWGGHSADRPRGSYTVVVIAMPVSPVKYQIVYADRLMSSDFLKQVKDITDLIFRFNCVKVIADQGYGHVQVQELQKTFSQRVFSCIYQNNLKSNYQVDTERQTVSTDRDYALEELYEEIQREQWIIPFPDAGNYAADDGGTGDKYEWLISHICNIEIVDVYRNGNTRKSFQKTNDPCDGLHALNYCRLALILQGHMIGKQARNNTGPIAPLLASFSGRKYRW